MHYNDTYELYLSECYSCDSNNEFKELRRYIIDNGIKLDALRVYRIQTSREARETAKDAKAQGICAPFLIINHFKDDTMTKQTIEYAKWVEEQKKEAEKPVKKRKTTKKTAKLDTAATKSTDME